MVWKFDGDYADALFSTPRDKYIEKLDHFIKELTSCHDAKVRPVWSEVKRYLLEKS
jgi:hypothetical protein